MSYNVFIADDEYFIRQRLKKIILWDEWNLNFCGEAENGQQVIDCLAQTPVDIVFLDIQMPIMSGLETATYIHDHYPNTKTIILSGYNKFEYMRAAIRACTFDFLLKPITQENLFHVLTDCINEIDKEKLFQKELDKKTHYNIDISLIKVRKNLISYSDFLKEYPEFGAYKFSLFIGLYTQYSKRSDVLKIKSLLQDLGMYCEFIMESEHIFTIQCFIESKEPISTLGSKLIQFINTTTEYTFLSLNNVFDVNDNWESYYYSAVKGLGHRFFSKTSDINVENTISNVYNFSKPLTSIREKIIHKLQGQNQKEITSYINEWFDIILREKNPTLLQYFINEILLAIHLHYNIPKDLYEPISAFCKNIIEEEYTLDALKEIIISYCNQCINQLDILPSDQLLARKVAQYVDNNYTTQDLCVSNISDVLGFNASYIGTIFKNTYSISILQYITKIRMKHATELLDKNEYLISTVAEMVGYSDVYYFSKRFKKIYGVSPKEYANKK